MPVAIVTDSVACLPQAVVDSHEITVVPLEVIYKGKVYRDGIDITAARFYDLLAASDEIPTSTAAPPEAYLEVYEKHMREGKEVLCICPSRKLTHAYESALVASKLFKEKTPKARVEVLDSGTVGGAQGFVVMDSAVAVKRGAGLEKAIKIAQEATKSVHLIAFLETLDYLAKGGRVPNVIAWANSILKIRVIIELLPQGRGVIPIDRARTRQRAMERLLELLIKKTRNLAARVAVQHTNSPEEAGYLALKVKSLPNCRQVEVQDFTPVMGVHTGPGLLGLAWSTCDVSEIEK